MKTRLSFLCGIVHMAAGLLLAMHVVQARGPRGPDCDDITTDVIRPSSIVTIDNIIGIPDEEEVEISCVCTGRRSENPEWSYNDESIPDTSRDDDEPYVDSTSTLRVDSFGEDSSGLYACITRDVTVEFNLAWYNPDRRPELIEEPRRQNVEIRNGDEKVTLRCIAFGADITWERRDDVPIPDKATQREGGAILEIPNVRREDDGDYRCVAENRDGRRTSKYAAVSVTEELDIVTDPVDVSQRVGTNVTLTCSGEGFQSENFIYLWINSSDDIVYMEVTSSGTSNLVFPAVRPSDAGEYRCIVQNEWGQQVTSRPATVQVETPRPFPPISILSGTVDQFSVTLNWELSTTNADFFDKIEISAEWISLLVFGSRTGGKRQVTGNSATVTISDPTTTQHTFTNLQPFSHYCFTVTALYAFEGEELGEVAAEPFCTNTSEAVPSAPQDVTVVSQGFTSLILIWTAPQSPNGIILNYTIKYNDKVEVIGVEDAKPTFTLLQLATGTTYNIRVSAVNSAGEGNYSNTITTNTLSITPASDRGQLMFQIKLESDEIEFCPTWISDARRHSIATTVFGFIEEECNCVLEEGALDQDHLLCDQSQSDKTVFRAEIVTNQLTRDDLIIIIQNMVTGGRLTLNESTVFRIDDTCPIKISSFSDPLCVVTAVGSVEDAETESTKPSSPTAPIVGSITALLFIILLVIAGIVSILYWRSKHRKEVSADDNLGEVRYNNHTSVLQTTQTMPYSTPLPLSVNIPECVIDKDGYLIPNKHKMENSDFPIPYVDFDESIYLKNIINGEASGREGNSQFKMQLNPSYYGTNITDDNSTEV